MDGFPQIHLPDWQFYLPRAIRQWDMPGGGTPSVKLVGRLTGFHPLFQGSGKNIESSQRCHSRLVPCSAATPFVRGPFKLEYFFHIISHVGLSEWSHAMWYSSFMIAQSLKTLKKNGPKLEIFQTTIIPCFTINISSLFVIWKKKKKKSAITKTTPPPWKW